MGRPGMSQGVGFVRKAPLHWVLGGLLLAAVVLVAECMKGPIDLSSSFVDPEIITAWTGIPSADLRAAKLGFDTWLIVGIFAGAAIAAAATGRWRVTHTSAWWSTNQGRSTGKRYAFTFMGGVLVMLGARLAHGCTTGQLLSGWSQLSATALPFTFSMIFFAMIVARLFHPEAPPIER